MRLVDLDTSHRYRAVVVATERLTGEDSAEDVREFTLEVAAPEFVCRPGQSIAVIISGPHELGHAEHLRLYTLAGLSEAADRGRLRVTICVRRCDYLDPYSGERYPGTASNWLCDRQVGDELVIAGPYGVPFEVPEDRNADLLLIGLGTGIAPFRAFVRHIYEELGGWGGRVMLFYGARTGLESLYMNERRDDFARYLDERTFRAFRALSPRPHWDEPPSLSAALQAHREEVWQMLGDPRTHVYVAGLQSLRASLDACLSVMAGSAERWRRRKAELEAGGRWVELLY